MHPECLAIKIPLDDSFYSKHNQTCMEFVRSSPAPLEGCTLGTNLKYVYGSSDKQANVLRAHKHENPSGLLSVQEIGFRQSLLPYSPESQPDECRDASTGNKYCFRAGDKRVNEQPGLSSMHTLWVREHNRVARELASLNPHWNDEHLYEESRRIIIAEMQHITYNEFLPVLLGPTIMKLFALQLEEKSNYYWGYDSDLDASMANVFGSAAFRFGHSLVPQSMQRSDKFYNVIESDIELSNEMMSPKILHNFGAIDRLLLGMVSQETQQRDEFISDQLTNHLFQNKVHSYGMDLIALNIQRGRDHGLPSYIKWRDYCGLRRPKNFSDLEGLLNVNTLRRLEKIYEYVEDVDLFPGGMAEKPVVGGLVGPTFACLIGQVFQILRKGDRFWYENGNFAAAFTIPQLEALRKSSLARILCDNLDDVESFQLRVMKAAKKTRFLDFIIFVVDLYFSNPR
uniref:Uncharacterized protein n=1 Tax=Strigamia maritima TaxID=126957 RepID=T1J925_STRMM